MARNRVLVSFIGRGALADPSKGQTAAARSGYRTATYDFGAGEKYETSLFAWAACQHLRAVGWAPDAWLLLGTSASLWPALMDAVTDESFERCEHWFVNVEKKTATNAVTQEDLDAAPPELAECLGVPSLLLKAVGSCADRAGQKRFMQMLAENLPRGAEVVLDITHGYRHLPVLAFFLIEGIRWLRDVHVKSVLYGAFEMSGTPVVDLSICADYADMSAELATFQWFFSNFIAQKQAA